MYKVFLVAAVMLLSARVYAQEFSIAGSVRDAKNNQVLTGATLQLEGTSRATVADAFGRFRFDKIAAGEYTVLVKFIGYADKSEKVSVSSSGVDIAIALQESCVMTHEILL